MTLKRGTGDSIEPSLTDCRQVVWQGDHCKGACPGQRSFSELFTVRSVDSAASTACEPHRCRCYTHLVNKHSQAQMLSHALSVKLMACTWPVLSQLSVALCELACGLQLGWRACAYAHQ